MEVILVILIVVVILRFYEKRGGAVDNQDDNYQEVSIAEHNHQNVHHYHHAPPPNKGRRGSLRCPKCKSVNVSMLDENKKSFSVGKAVVGSVVTLPFSGIGGLIGFAGGKRKKKIFVCNQCGNTFKFKVR